MIVAYHEIVPHPAHYIYSVDVTLFRAQLAWLALQYRRTGVGRVTFDDGHASQYRHALEPLGDAGLSATFFITAGWTGVRPEYMTWSELQALVAAGHSVQAHGWSHKLLTSCSDHDLRDELMRPKKTLEDRLGIRVDSLSMPGGRCNGRVIRACVEAGYKCLYTSNPWVDKVQAGILQPGRLMIRNTTGVQHLSRHAVARNNPVAPERLLFEVKSLTRRVAGDALYQRLWRIVGHKQSTREIDAQYSSRHVGDGVSL